MKKVLLILMLIVYNHTLAQSQDGPNNPSSSSTSGSDINWNNISNGYTSDNSRSATDNMAKNDISDYLIYTDFNFLVPTGSVIKGIEVGIEKRMNPTGSGNMRDYTIQLTNDGTSSTGSDYANTTDNWATSDDVSLYGGNSDLWGTIWSTTDINSSTFGIMIRTKKRNNGDAKAQIDNVYITIYYEKTLPIELFSFKSIVTNDKTIDLIWVTLSETNNDYFTLEKSQDAINYTTLCTTPGAGNSNNQLNYVATDINPYPNVSYYRLKQTDFDGKETVFDPIVVHIVDDDLSYTIYPNPVGGNNVILFINNKSSDPLLIKIYNENNSTVYNNNVNSQNTITTINFDLYNNGIYFLNIINQSTQKTVIRKIIKSN
jgi:hypothetical protein